MQSSSDRIKPSDIELRQNKLPRKKLLTKSDRRDKISELPRKNDNKEKNKKVVDNDLKI